MRVALALMSFLLAAPAAAQNSSTTCYPIGNQVQCDTRTQPQYPQPAHTRQPFDPMKAFREGYEIGEQMRRDREAAEAAQAARAYQQRQEQTRFDASATARVVGALILEGKCDDARAVALDRGEIAMAGDVMKACINAAPVPVTAPAAAPQNPGPAPVKTCGIRALSNPDSVRC